jgi:hypothetical protein
MHSFMHSHTKAAFCEIQTGLKQICDRRTLRESRHEEFQYLGLIQDVLDRGEPRVRC